MRWQDCENEKEKYGLYLASREWAEKRDAAKKRSGGHCERCLVNPVDHVHHLTYARKYNESLTDLQAICKDCHDFIHNKSTIDYLKCCKPALSAISEWPDGTDRNSIVCPVCGYDYIHFGPLSVPQSDLSQFSISFRGECGHEFDLTFEFHKGNMSAWLSNFRSTSRES